MKAFLQFIFRSTAAFTATGAFWLISFFAFSTGWLLATGIGIAGGIGTYYTLKEVAINREAKAFGLSRKEYKFIENNLKDAKQKILRLQKAFIQVRQFGNARENTQILQTVRRIYANTKREPHRFYQAEDFYYRHLDSLVEIAEKYAYISKQAVKTRELNDMMRDSRHTIIVLGGTVKKDLKSMLRDDVNTLDFELDVVKRRIEKPKNTNGGIM